MSELHAVEVTQSNSVSRVVSGLASNTLQPSRGRRLNATKAFDDACTQSGLSNAAIAEKCGCNVNIIIGLRNGTRSFAVDRFSKAYPELAKQTLTNLLEQADVVVPPHLSLGDVLHRLAAEYGDVHRQYFERMGDGIDDADIDAIHLELLQLRGVIDLAIAVLRLMRKQ